MHSTRENILRSIASRKISEIPPDHVVKKVSEIYGTQIFSLKEMQQRLSPQTFEGFKKILSGGEKMDTKLAEAMAEAIKSWAVSRGATHFTHWFQPLTGLTAEKHDAFLSYDGQGFVIEKLSASQLIQSEPDASSFPSGGSRSTFEARGYTAWDFSSPVFIVERAGAKVLCIPSVFVSYTGQSLDTKTALLRSIDALNHAATNLLREMGETKVSRVTTTVGCEQEYFLVDSNFVRARPDLLLAGRTLLGGDMPKGQQLEDHYFGCIPARVQAFMVDMETELYRLGIPVKTRHNEVAPAQFEMAPIFEEANIAADHNMLTMEVMKHSAERHGFACLLHEKPFAGINGSGKHCNWSVAAHVPGSKAGEEKIENLLEPGTTPQRNFRFLAVLSAVLHAVFKNQVALRAAIATHGNDHRLGANEAPPAIISVFLGSTLSEILAALEKGHDLSKISAEKAMIEFGLNRLPAIPKDNTDRNRTSPFAFTGNKFEFRAVGSSHSIAFPMTVLNAAVAESLKLFTTKMKAKVAGGAAVESALLEVAKEFITESKHIRFEGDGYSEDWRNEAKRRGLFQLLNTPKSLEAFSKADGHAALIQSGTFKKEELHAYIEIQFERYVKHLGIEAEILCMLTKQYVVPAGVRYQSALAKAISAAEKFISKNAVEPTLKVMKEVLELTNASSEGAERVGELLKQVSTQSSQEAAAHFIGDSLVPAMQKLRASCDKLETVVSDEHWSLPKYREMLFIR